MNKLKWYENQNDIEHILDYLFANQIDISKIWYKTILEKANKRTKKLQSLSSKDNEEEWVDYAVDLDFWDWFKFVKLISENSYIREWKLMSHCVSSYYWRGVNIYSLRDEKNNPHCTVEENKQIKWKWNWCINPKYIDYVVMFLEHKWMDVREHEMKNLWYYLLSSIDQHLSCEKQYKWYVYQDDIKLIKDKEWNIYKWMWLFNIWDICNRDWALFHEIKNISQYSSTIEWADSASGDSSKLEISWSSSVWANIWIHWSIKWVLWTWIVLAEYDNKWKVLSLKCWIIDGIDLFPNIEYILRDWEFAQKK